MANPNIVSVTEIIGEVAGAAVTTAGVTMISAVATGHVAKVNAIYVSNIDGTNSEPVNVIVNDGAANDWNIASTITVPADSTIDVLSKSVYLKEGWSLKLSADATDGRLEAVVSWEDLTDL